MRTFLFALAIAFATQCSDAHAFKVGGMTWPTGAGTANQCLQTDGIRTLTFADVLHPDDLSATSPITYNPSTGVIAIPVATSSVNGYLSSTDWSTFNNKQPAGNYITALTGEGSASGPGSATFTLGATIAGATTFSTSLTSPIFKSSTSNPASAGQIRLASSDTIKVRSTANTWDNSISVANLITGFDEFTFLSSSVATDGAIAVGDFRNGGYGIVGAYTFLGTNQSNFDQINLHGGTKDYTYLGITDSNGTPGVFGGLHIEDVADGARQLFAKSRGTPASRSIVQSGDELGVITAAGFDGSDYEPGARILFSVNGTPGNNDMPGAITFQTTPDGSITLATALTIGQNQVATFAGGVNVTGLTASRAVFTDGSKNLVSNAITGSGNVVMSASPTLTGTAIAASITMSGHLKFNGTAPTATVNANAGTGATCTLSNASDVAGTINLTTTAVASAAGEQCKVNFNAAYGVAPICTFSAASANAVNFEVIQGAYQTTTTAKLSLNFATAELVGRTYNWSYICVETQ